MADRPLSAAERLKNEADAKKKGQSVAGSVETKKMTPGDPDSPDLAAAAKKANAEAAKKAKEPEDPDVEDPNDSPIVAAAKKRRRDAKAKGQKGAMRRSTVTIHLS